MSTLECNKTCLGCGETFPATPKYYWATGSDSRHIGKVSPRCRACSASDGSRAWAKALMLAPEGTKPCKRCLETLPLTARYFHVKKKGRGGFVSLCRACKAHPRLRLKRRLEMDCSDGYRVCSKCYDVKPETPEWFTRSQNPNGLSSHCKDCTRAYSKQYAAANADQRKAYYQANRERFAARHREWYLQNCEKEKERVKRWNEANPERVAVHRANEDPEKRRAASRRYYHRNKDKARVHVLNRISRKREAEGEHTFDEVWQMLEDQEHKCAYCEEPLFGVFHVDHMQPLSRGGRNDWTNLAVTCPFCNLSKHAKTPLQFLEVLGHAIIKETDE